MPQGPTSFGSTPGNDVAMAALICGAVSMLSNVCCCIPFVNWFAWIVVVGAAIGAIVCGIIGFQKSKELNGIGKNESLVGIGLGTTVFVLGIVMMILAVVFGVFAGLAGRM